MCNYKVGFGDGISPFGDPKRQRRPKRESQPWKIPPEKAQRRKTTNSVTDDILTLQPVRNIPKPGRTDRRTKVFACKHLNQLPRCPYLPNCPAEPNISSTKRVNQSLVTVSMTEVTLYHRDECKPKIHPKVGI